MKKKVCFFILLLLFGICISGCSGSQGSESNDNNTTEPVMNGTIDEKLDENLYVKADFHMPETELHTWTTELKQFDYDHLQSVFWPGSSSDEIQEDEFGYRQYGKAGFGGERGSLIYRANEEVEHMDTLCA